MKWPAVLILVAILLTASLQPLTEFVNILKEKVVLDAALMNSCRAAHNNALNIWYLMNLETYVNENDFIALFSASFAEALNLTYTFEPDTDTVQFTSVNDRFDTITVRFEFDHTLYDALAVASLGETSSHNRPVTVVTLDMQTNYIFRTYWLSLANEGSGKAYMITDTRKYLLQIIN